MNRSNFTAYPLPPTEEEAKLAKESSQILAGYTQPGRTPNYQVKTDEIIVRRSRFLSLLF